jgi:hypothetical protein
MYVNRGTLLNIIMLGKKIFNFLNKHFYIILIISTITKYTNHKFYKSIIWLVKVFVIINILFGVGYIVYFSTIEHSINNGLSLYLDLINYYLNKALSLYNELRDFDLEETVINHALKPDDINLKIKEGVKDGIKEALQETIDKLHEDEMLNNSNFYKNIAYYTISTGVIVFIGYFMFVLPGTTDDLTSFNTINQSLIVFKVNIINFLGKPSNPGTGTTGNFGGIGSSQVQNVINSPAISEGGRSTNVSDYLPTITQNTPVMPSIPLDINAETSAFTPMIGAPQAQQVDVGIQTRINAITVSRMEDVLNTIDKVLPNEVNNVIKEGVNNRIINITD